MALEQFGKKEIKANIQRLTNDINDLKKNKPYLKKLKIHVVDFLKRNNVIVYGGIALNNRLPESDKIYAETDLPDYDCYHYDALKCIKKLAIYLKNHKYEFIEVYEALHEKTYKLTVEFKQICDITLIDKKSYDLLNTDENIINGLITCPIELTKSSFYLELSIPNSTLFRWNKVFDRLILTEAVFVDRKITVNKVTVPVIIDRLISEIHEEIKDNEDVLICGNFALDKLKIIEDDVYLFPNTIGCCQFIATDVKSTTDTIERILKNRKIHHKIETHNVSIFPKVINFTTVVSDQKINLCSVIKSEHCFTYYEVDGYKIASHCTLLYISYYFIFYYNSSKVSLEEKNERNMLTNIAILLKTNLDVNKMDILCEGHEKTLSVLKKIQWKKNIKIMQF